MFLQSLVTTADKNNDNMMDFSEFEGFNDFRFFPLEWYRGTGQTAMKALRSFTVCDGRESCLPCSESNPGMLLRSSSIISKVLVQQLITCIECGFKISINLVREGVKNPSCRKNTASGPIIFFWRRSLWVGRLLHFLSGISQTLTSSFASFTTSSSTRTSSSPPGKSRSRFECEAICEHYICLPL